MSRAFFFASGVFLICQASWSSSIPDFTGVVSEVNQDKVTDCDPPEMDFSNALWRLINQCAVSQREGRGPAPCVVFQPDFGILKDRKGSQHYLLLPTRRLTGIESPEIRDPQSPNYFAKAWTEGRRAVEQKLGKRLSRESIGLAINSADRRTQRQLHIHIDCVDPAVTAELKKHAHEIGKNWDSKPIHLYNADYRALAVEGDDLEMNPFAFLAKDLGKNVAKEMKHHSLVVVGAVLSNGKNGFYVLDVGGRSAHGEDLLDFDCEAAKAN